jgi:hypothetical protein
MMGPGIFHIHEVLPMSEVKEWKGMQLNLNWIWPALSLKL